MVDLGVLRQGQQFNAYFHVVNADSTPGEIDNTPTLRLYHDGGDLAGEGWPAPSLVRVGATNCYYVRGYAPVDKALFDAGSFVVFIEGALIDGVTVSAAVAQFRVGLGEGVMPGRLFDAVSAGGFTISTAAGWVANSSGTPEMVRSLVRAGHYIKILTGTGAQDFRLIDSYDPATGVGTVRPNFSAVPGLSAEFLIFESAPSDVVAESDFADDALSARVLAASAAAEIAAAVGSGISLADGSLTEAKFGTDALSARVLKADAAAEIQSGLAKTSELTPLAKTTDLSPLATTAGLAPLAKTTDLAPLATAAGLTPLAKTTDLAPLALASAVASVQADTDAIQAAVAAVLADTDNIQTRLPAALVSGKMNATATVTGLDAGTLTAVANAIWDAVDKIEPGISPTAALRVLMAVFAGLSAGVTSGAPVFRSADLVGGVVQGSKSRVIGVQDAADQRTSVTLDVSAV